MIKSISEKKEISLSRFIYALGIRNVGEETAIDLANNFGSVKKLKEAELQGLESILNIGPVVAKSIYEWFNDKNNLKLLDKFEKVITIKNHPVIQPGVSSDNKAKLKGKTFVLTGGLESMSRDEARAKIRELGGDISESVSSKTSFVIVGKEPGSKAEKAKKFGVKIINEKEFLKIIK